MTPRRAPPLGRDFVGERGAHIEPAPAVGEKIGWKPRAVFETVTAIEHVQDGLR